MTSGQHIDYDALALEALRGVVKACLAQVARTGLVGEHHFYIAFNTQAPGVGMSKRLKEKYPLEMTIVLQHRFWDLAVDDERFEVKLTFDGIPERLVVPFAAVRVFYDPSVPYVLQFDDPAATSGVTANASSATETPAQSLSSSAKGAESAPRETFTVHRSDGEAGNGKRGVDAAPRRLTGEAGTSAIRPAPDRKAPAVVKPERTNRTADTVTKDGGIEPAAPPAVASRAQAGPADSDAESTEAAPAANGAKIFDLSKFRGKK
jgi:hypothetical protein